ncbi:hypothetical protein FOA52_013067 [Chlamydomonas sp. UWO 241]|nr:hypothetical protein FOA52_013067 [Chlamydomonas sp. UWO 241]
MPTMTNNEPMGAIVNIIVPPRDERSPHESDFSNRPELSPERALVLSTTPAPVDTIMSEPAADNSSVGASLELKTAHALVSSTTSDDTPRDVIDEIPNVNKSVLMLSTPVTITSALPVGAADVEWDDASELHIPIVKTPSGGSMSSLAVYTNLPPLVNDSDGEDDYTEDVYFPEGLIHASGVHTIPDISEPVGALPPHILPVGALLPHVLPVGALLLHAPPVGALPPHRDICVLAKLPGGFSDTDFVGD